MLWEFLKEKISLSKNSLIYEEDVCITYSQLIEQAENFAKKLLKGHVYAVLCQSEQNTAVSILACFAAQAIAVPLSVRYGEKHCRRILSTVQPYQMITDQSGSLQCENTEYQSSSDENLCDVCLILCTSGTTGVPKGAMITQKNIKANLRDIQRYFELSNQDKVFIIRPLYHCAVLTGEFLVSLMQGAEIHFYNKPFNPIAVSTYIDQNQITIMGGTPTIFYHLINIWKRIPVRENRLRSIVVSGECMSERVAKELIEFLPEVQKYNVYGLTEASPRVSYLPPDDFEQCYLSVGRPLHSVQIKVVDRKGMVVTTGKVGELLVKGPNVMFGYYHAPEITALKLIDGWLHTGDLAYLDDRGYLYIKGRKDNMIIRAGVNIYPQEIENVLRENKDIREAMAYGFQDSGIGQGIGLKVVVDSDIKKKEIYQYCKERLPDYELPNVIEIVDELPRNASGKLIRGGQVDDRKGIQMAGNT